MSELLEQRLAEAYAKIEEMKCCGNCKHYTPFILPDRCYVGLKYREDHEPISTCDKWDMRKVVS